MTTLALSPTTSNNLPHHSSQMETCTGKPIAEFPKAEGAFPKKPCACKKLGSWSCFHIQFIFSLQMFLF